MRILLVDSEFASASTSWAVVFGLQLVRQAVAAGHELHRLVPHTTEAGKGLDVRRHDFRRRLDVEIDIFDPQIVHLHGIGMVGHLVLESGVPYLLSTWGQELPDCLRNAPVRDLAQQVLENAGRVIVDGEPTLAAVQSVFGLPDRPIVCLTDRGWPAISAAPPAGDFQPPALGWLWGLYGEIVNRRSGAFQEEP